MQEEKHNPNIEEQLAEYKQKADEYLNNWKRAAADFINYKKEEIDRMTHLMQHSREDMLLKALAVFDSIYLSEKQLPENLKKGESDNAHAVEWTKGFLQIRKQIDEFLKREGISEIEVIGKEFNAETMEIIDSVEAGNPGMVIEELQKGYMFHGKVLRPAKVKVSK